MTGGIPGTVWIWALASQKVKPSAAQRRAPRRLCWGTFLALRVVVSPILTAGRRFPGGFDAALDDMIESRLAEPRARAPPVAVDAGRLFSRRSPQRVGADQTPSDNHCAGSVRRTR